MTTVKRHSRSPIAITTCNNMGPLDALWHLGNLFAIPLMMGVIAAGLAKLLWPTALAGVGWKPLALWCCGAACGITLAGLVLFGRDGRMATYAAMVLACALVLWWRGFGPGARRGSARR